VGVEVIFASRRHESFEVAIAGLGNAIAVLAVNSFRRQINRLWELLTQLCQGCNDAIGSGKRRNFKGKELSLASALESACKGDAPLRCLLELGGC
jgi:hypothetical protein